MANRAYIANQNKSPKSTTSTTSTQSGTRAASSSGSASGMSNKASNLSQYYSGKGSQLGNSVQSRFSDPNFSSAAQRAGISQSQYSINPGNASYNQAILRELQNGGNTQTTNPLDNAQVQTQTTPTNQTVGEILGTPTRQYQDFSYSASPQDRTLKDALSYYSQQSGQNVNENQIRRDILNQFNDRIAATNQIYDENLARARQIGQGDVGSGTALLAARGLTGSGRGMAMAQGIQDENLQREEGIQAQRLAAISAIQNEAQTLAQQAIADKNAAKQAGYSNYIAYLGKYNEQKDAAKSALAQSIISKGLDINTINPQQLESIAKGIGATGDEVRSAYDVLKQEQDAMELKALQDGAFNLSEGQARYDAQGNLIAERAKTYKGGGGSGGGNASGAQRAISAISGTSGGNLDTNSLQDAIAFLSPGMAKNEREAFNTSVNRFLKAGNTKAVEELIFKTAVNQLPDAGTKANVTKKRAIYNQVGELASALDEFYAKGGSTDILTGKKQAINNKLGNVANPELRSIGQRVTFLVDELGKAQSGAALNANEEALYKSLFPSANKTAALNTADVGALQEALRSSVEETVGVALGSSGVNQVSGSVFGDQPKKPKATPPPAPKGSMRVRLKSSGQIGDIPASEFNSALYERV